MFSAVHHLAYLTDNSMIECRHTHVETLCTRLHNVTQLFVNVYKPTFVKSVKKLKKCMTGVMSANIFTYVL